MRASRTRVAPREVRDSTTNSPPGADGGLVPPPYLREGSLELPLQPGYAELSLREVAELAGHESIWLTVESTSSNNIWAFVSITNDATQEITVVTPR